MGYVYDQTRNLNIVQQGHSVWETKHSLQKLYRSLSDVAHMTLCYEKLDSPESHFSTRP